MKQCNRCLETKPKDCFHVSKLNKGGLRTHCKACRSAEAAARNLANKEKNAERLKRKYAVDGEKLRAQRNAWKAANPDKVKAMRVRYCAANKDKNNSRSEAWRLANMDRVREAARIRERSEKYKAMSNAIGAKRRAAATLATPRWADRAAINRIYMDALRAQAQTGSPHHVDHIVPLMAKTVCGLHCEANLRVIHAHDNIVKSNRHWPDMP